jgi:altronate dehydratase small subunit
MIMHHEDNVAVCIRELKEGEALTFQHNDKDIQLRIKAPIPLGHKIAIKAITSGKPIMKYGEIIGKATKDIASGQHVHVHNVTD